MRLSGTKTGSINQYRGLGDQLWDLGGSRPSLDLNFAHSKDLTDATTGKDYVDFTRASSGTYVGSDGLIKTAVTNLLPQSEDFSTTWGNTLLTDNVDATAAPNGTITADEIIETTATNIRSKEQNITSVASAVYTLSVFAKSGNGDKRYLRLSLNSAASTSLWAAASYDLDDGTVASSDSAGGGTVTSTSIQSFGNGWYRCILTGNIGANTDLRALVTLTPSSSTYTPNGRGRTSYTGDGVSSIYIWGAQLEQSDTVGEYIPTTSTINSAPRFDHDPTTGESLGLLVEESRTNQFQASSFAGAGWIEDNLSVISSNNLAPDGSNTAVIVGNATSTLVNSFLSYSKNVTGVLHTFSFYAKATTAGQSAFIDYYDAGVNRARGFINLDNGTVSYHSQAGDGVIKAVNAGNGWWRCQLTLTPAGSTLYEWRAGNADNGNVYLWGAQLEAGSFPTSYIPTTSSTVTRAADVASISGSNFSSWYRQDEGTVFINSYPASFTQVAGLASFDDGTTSNRIQVRFSSTGSGSNVVSDGGSLQANYSTLNTGTAQTFNKTALAYKINDFALVLNNGTVTSDTAGSVPTSVDRLSIGNNVGANPANCPIRRLVYWSQRLPNDTLQTITQ